MPRTRGGGSSIRRQRRPAPRGSNRCCARASAPPERRARRPRGSARCATSPSTPGTVDWLRQVWEKKETVTGLPLAEADYTALALELAVRQVDGWNEHPEDPAVADRESRSQGPLPVRDAGALRRSGGARAVVPVARATSTIVAASRGCSKASATCIIRCARTRRRNTCSRRSTCCGKSRRPAISSSRSDGSTPRSAATRARMWPTPCAGS